jgi:hypothetical protein
VHLGSVVYVLVSRFSRGVRPSHRKTDTKENGNDMRCAHSGTGDGDVRSAANAKAARGLPGARRCPPRLHN